MTKGTLVASVRRNDPVVYIEPRTSRQIHRGLINRSSFIFTQLTRRHLTLEQESDILFQRIRKEIVKRYNQKVTQKRQEINSLLSTVNAPANTYKENQVSDIICQIREMDKENGGKLIQFIKKINNEAARQRTFHSEETPQGEETT